ncbi:MAG: TraR/DksA family transcriptional regulator [Alphaproteobacteria bacterium]|jgi:DnaK suppressor protein|nr:TraR/DksA family transcriptional regulator [Alphaproteobacteria bacterium]
MLTDAEIETLKETLQASLAELERIDASSADSRKAVELDQQSVGRLSRMDAMQQQQMALATERRRQTEKRKLQAALSRIAAGDYGFCVRCGEDIDPPRLRIDPAAPLCGDCAKGAG